jgi:ribonuclease BN (tRNA processing enzyme)
MTAHTSSADLGRVAASCEVKTRVLSHIAPGNTPPWRFQSIKRDFPGRLIVGEDLLEIGVGRPRRRR